MNSPTMNEIKSQPLAGKARQTIYDNMKAGTFPKAVRIGPRSIAWDAGEIAEWQKKVRDER
ncbi:helix-turn-helix transcriptional regulator [Janthinobacterium sp. HLX7-2]|uniref:helix-turn-helix transcriptional regulator n=1 Tax=Janthinobacterium sp. HLX7-2 TaxID=1259331 RepID=UPI003F213783